MAKKKLYLIIAMAVLVFVLAVCNILLLVWYDGKIDSSITCENLEELQAVLSDDFYFFDFDNQKQEQNYYAVTNTQSYRRRQRGDFEYIGYSIRYVISIDGSDDRAFNMGAMLGKTLEETLDYESNKADDVVVDRIEVDGIECLFIRRPRNNTQLYFMIGTVRYCFETAQRGIKKEILLSICEPAIVGRYKAAEKA